MHRSPRILVVEDEFLIAMELDITLTSAGYQVLGPAPNVGAALGLLRPSGQTRLFLMSTSQENGSPRWRRCSGQ